MKDYALEVQSIEFLTADVFELVLYSKEALPQIKGGQFVNLEITGTKFLLRRPFCVYKSDLNTITLIIAVVGKGTAELSKIKKGDILRAILPLGNGFELKPEHKRVAIVGGGIGCAALLGIINQYQDKTFKAYLGFSTKEKVIFKNDFSSLCETIIATDDGSYGKNGFVTDVFCSDIDTFKPDIVLTCGSELMLKALKNIITLKRIPTLMSGEARMACGVGACLVCTCAVKTSSGEVRNLRACADGPVFNLEDIAL